MSLSSHFDVKANLYFRVRDAEIYGGPGTVGYGRKSIELLSSDKLEDLNDTIAMGCLENTAAKLNISPEQLEFISAEEYERENDEWSNKMDNLKKDLSICEAAKTELWKQLVDCRKELHEAKSELNAMRNELCLMCGKFRDAHNGACDGCRWKQEA